AVRRAVKRSGPIFWAGRLAARVTSASVAGLPSGPVNTSSTPFGPAVAGVTVTATRYGPTLVVALDAATGLGSESLAGASSTSTAVTPSTTTSSASSAPTTRRNRRRSASDAIPARNRGTLTRLLNAPRPSSGRTSAALTSTSSP